MKFKAGPIGGTHHGERVKEFISDGQLMQELFQIQQEENQSATSFYFMKMLFGSIRKPNNSLLNNKHRCPWQRQHFFSRTLKKCMNLIEF